jgi:hypothetical protein
VGSAFPPNRMAECNLPYIEEIAGELIVSCEICPTDPQPLFDPVIPLPLPPSFDFGCYPFAKPDYEVFTPRGNPASATANSFYIDPSIKYLDYANVGYCRPEINIDMRFPTTKSHAWDACDWAGSWPWEYDGQEIDPFTGDPIAEADQKIEYCCYYPDDDCLMDWECGTHGEQKQYANWGCDTLKLVVADRSAYTHKEEVKAGEGDEDNHLELGYVEVQFPVCDVAFSFVCDVYCDDTELTVAFRRAYFKRGILVQLDTYEEGGSWAQDDTNVYCGEAAECP